MATPAEPLLDVRALVVLWASVLTGLVAGVLSYLASSNVPAAILVRLGAVAIALPLVHTTIAWT
jgi:hypothetical protein